MMDDVGNDAQRSIGRWFFDAAVLLAIASAVLKFVDDQGEPGLRFALLAVVMFVPRWVDVPAPFAAAAALCLLTATWASVQHWYRGVPLADEIVHLFTPASVAAAAFFWLVQQRVLPDVGPGSRSLRGWSPVLWVTLLGVLTAVVWEFYEWVVEQFSPRGMLVGYTDTVLDLAAGTAGSVVAGGLVLGWLHHQASQTAGS